MCFAYQSVTRHAMIRLMSKYPLVNRGDTTVIIGNVNSLDITELYREGPQKYLCGMLSGKYDDHIFNDRNKFTCFTFSVCKVLIRTLILPAID